jgi:hypothetical protein
MYKAFVPNKTATVNIDVSNANQRVLIYPNRKQIQIRIMNNGSATVWIEFGDVTVVASAATGIPIGPGVTEVLTATIGENLNPPMYVAAIAAASTGKVYFTPGEGI